MTIFYNAFVVSLHPSCYNTYCGLKNLSVRVNIRIQGQLPAELMVGILTILSGPYGICDKPNCWIGIEFSHA